MQHIAAWLTRLSRAERQDVKTHVARVFHTGHRPSPLRLGAISVLPETPMPSRPGDTGPEFISFLRFPDVLPISEQVLQLSEELGALLCLSARRRVFLPLEFPATVAGKGPLHFIRYGGGLDRELIGPLPSDALSTFAELLELTPALSPSSLEALGAAMQLHYGACALIERDVRSSYVLLVAALEVLSRQFGTPPREWTAWDEAPDWDKVFLRIGLAAAQEDALKSQLLANRQLRLKRTFIEYASQSIPDAFWEVPWEQWTYSFRPATNDWSEGTVSVLPVSAVLPRDRAVLARSLASTYDTRSAYVHRGTQFDQASSLRNKDIPVNGKRPVPYQLLRLLVRELIRHEFRSGARSS